MAPGVSFAYATTVVESFNTGKFVCTEDCREIRGVVQCCKYRVEAIIVNRGGTGLEWCANLCFPAFGRNIIGRIVSSLFPRPLISIRFKSIALYYMEDVTE